MLLLSNAATWFQGLCYRLRYERHKGIVKNIVRPVGCLLLGLFFMAIVGAIGHYHSVRISRPWTKAAQEAVWRQYLLRNKAMHMFDPEKAAALQQNLTALYKSGAGNAEIAAFTWRTWESYKLDQLSMKEYPAKPKPDTGTGVYILNSDLLVKLVIPNSPIPINSHSDTYSKWQPESAPGTVAGPMVFANQGLERDYKFLQGNGIKTGRRIILANYHQASEIATKLLLAEAWGASGLLMYQAKGPANVEQGISLTDDDFSKRIRVTLQANKSVDFTTQELPTHLPVRFLNASDARSLACALSGPEAPDLWSAKPSSNCTFHLGPGFRKNPSYIVRIGKAAMETQTSIYHVVGYFRGSQHPDEYIIIGAVYNGAAAAKLDKANGRAITILSELVRVLGQLKTTGWKPKRTIVVCAWDGHEGSDTEWLQSNVKLWTRRSVVYLNLVVDRSLQNKWIIDTVPMLSELVTKAVISVRGHLGYLERSYLTSVTRGANRTFVRRSQIYVLSNGAIRQSGPLAIFATNLGTPFVNVQVGSHPLDMVAHVLHVNGTAYMRTDEELASQIHILPGEFLADLVISLSEPDILPMNVTLYASSILKWYRKAVKRRALSDELEERVERLDRTMYQFLLQAQLFDSLRPDGDHERPAGALSSKVQIRSFNSRLMSLADAFLNADNDATTNPTWQMPLQRHCIFGEGEFRKRGTHWKHLFPILIQALERYEKAKNASQERRFEENVVLELENLETAISAASSLLEMNAFP